MQFLNILTICENGDVIHSDNRGGTRVRRFGSKAKAWERLKRDALKAYVSGRQYADPLAARERLAKRLKAALEAGLEPGYSARLYCCDTGYHERSGRIPHRTLYGVAHYLDDVSEWCDGPGSAWFEPIEQVEG